MTDFHWNAEALAKLQLDKLEKFDLKTSRCWQDFWRGLSESHTKFGGNKSLQASVQLLLEALKTSVDALDQQRSLHKKVKYLTLY